MKRICCDFSGLSWDCLSWNVQQPNPLPDLPPSWTPQEKFRAPAPGSFLSRTRRRSLRGRLRNGTEEPQKCIAEMFGRNGWIWSILLARWPNVYGSMQFYMLKLGESGLSPCEPSVWIWLANLQLLRIHEIANDSRYHLSLISGEGCCQPYSKTSKKGWSPACQLIGILGERRE